MALRAAKGLSQADIARRIDCSQSRVSKLESGMDADLRLGDFEGYANALGLEMRIVLAPRGQTALDEIKYHAFSIKRILDRIATISSGDESMTTGAMRMMWETFYNITRMIRGASARLAHPAGFPKVEVQEESELPQDPLSADACAAAS